VTGPPEVGLVVVCVQIMQSSSLEDEATGSVGTVQLAGDLDEDLVYM